MSILRVWRLRLDTENFQTLRLARPEEFFARFPRAFTGVSMTKAEVHFEPTACVANEQGRPAADFSSLLPGMFVISERVHRSELFGYAISPSAEVGELSVAGERRYAVNVVDIHNALDRSRSVLKLSDGGKIIGIEQYAFHTERIGSEGALFKLPETATREVFAWHRAGERGEDEWHDLPGSCRRCNFTGLDFELLVEEPGA